MTSPSAWAGLTVDDVTYFLTAISAYWVAAALALLFYVMQRRRDVVNALVGAAVAWLLLRALGAILRVLIPCVAPDAESSFGLVVAVGLAYLLPLRLWQRLLCGGIVAATAVSRFVALDCSVPGEVALALGLAALGAALLWLVSRLRAVRRLGQRVALAIDDWTSRGGRTALTPPLVAVLRARLRQHLDFTLETLQPVGARGVHASTPVLASGRCADGRACRYFIKIVTAANWQNSFTVQVGNRLRARGRARGYIWPSLKSLVGYEHYMLLLFQSLGVPAPEPLGVYRLERSVYALVTGYLEGVRTLREAGEVSAAYVGRALAALQRLREADCAHGDIKASNLVVLPGERFAFVDLALAEYVAGRRRLALDLANLLVVLSLHHEPEAVVQMAREIIGEKGLRQARSYLHRGRLNTETRQMVPLDLTRRLRELISRRARHS